MTQWIQSSHTFQDGTPITKRIKIEGMGEEIVFTDKAYAEVSVDVADLLASQNDFITKVSAPSTPGTYYSDPSANATISVTLPDDAFNHFTAESGDVDVLDADEISNTIEFASPSDNAPGIQSAIDNVSAKGGGTVIPKPGTYSISSLSEEIQIPSNVTVDALSLGSATVKIGNDIGDVPHVFRFKPGASNAALKNVIVDGNESNNRTNYGNTFNSKSGIAFSDANDGEAWCSNCLVENVISKNTIRDNIVFEKSEDCTVRNVYLENSLEDHLMYLARCRRNHIENVYATGYAKGSIIAIGTGSQEVVNNTLENIRIENPVKTTPSGHTVNHGINIRADTNAYGNSIDRYLYTDDDSNPTTQVISVGQKDTTLKNISANGEFDATDYQYWFEVTSGATGSTIENLNLELENASLNNGYFVGILADNISVNDVELKEPNTARTRGYNIKDGATNVSISSSNYDSGKGTLARVVGDTTAVRQLAIVNSPDGTIDASGTVTYQSGSSFPQDVTNITSPYTGYQAYNDGTTGTEGPCHYTSGGSWVSDVDGTTIA